MTIQEAVATLDKLKPNQYDTTQKITWLSKLDGLIYKDVFQTHQDNPLPDGFTGYDSDTPQSTELLVQAPYDEDLYVYYLQACVDRENGEYLKYNQSITLYNNAYNQYQSWYNREHMPVQRGSRIIF